MIIIEFPKTGIKLFRATISQNILNVYVYFIFLNKWFIYLFPQRITNTNVSKMISYNVTSASAAKDGLARLGLLL